MIMDNQKNYSAALDDLQRVIEQAPNFKQAYLLGAQIMQNSGNPMLQRNTCNMPIMLK
jgi:Tfp pilus assembly protein PilF